ncbi:MAG: Uncharacterized protein G01um101419_798 [Parcubacteria group bacterium Gr01-1014_19]|nr:MAG: Uncharacterized protein G01um101419_798 [Parcubacteria group bacterium Gr01-1014_19]
MPRLYEPAATKIYQDQEKNLKIDRVRSWAELKNRHRSYKLKINPRVKKIAKILDKEIWLIDGIKIRGNKKYPSVDVDFTSGGHGCRYIYSPLNEIWIDKALDKDDIWPTMWHEFTERHLMERGLSYNDAHDYAARVEIGIRRGAEFCLPLINVDQARPSSCGAAVLRMVLEYLGKEVPEKKLIKLANTASGAGDSGTDPADMVMAAKKLGFRVLHKEGWTPAQVKKTLESGLPVIVNFQETPKFGDGHYVVIIGYTKDEL